MCEITFRIAMVKASNKQRTLLTPANWTM